jgi:hypothetical protein
MVSRIDLREKSNVFGWSAKVDFMVNSVAGFRDLDASSVSLLWRQPYILALEPRDIHPNLARGGAQGYRLTIEATDTASDAEALGTRVALSLLVVAARRRWGLSLSWPDMPLPCRVIDRTASRGMSMQAFGSVKSELSVGEFVSQFETAFETYPQVPYRLLLSLELCTSSKFETNTRSRLILLVSALEALAEQQDVTSQAGVVVAEMKAVLSKADIADARLKSSLLGQLENLNRESARRAIRRLLEGDNFAADDIEFVDEAYQARSKIVHEGRRVPELDAMANRLEGILLRLYGVS